MSGSTLEVNATKIDLSNRVWAPPTIFADRLILYGRNTLSFTLLNTLAFSKALPEGTCTNAMIEVSRIDELASTMKMHFV